MNTDICLSISSVSVSAGYRYGALTIEYVFDYTKFSIRNSEGGFVIGAFIGSTIAGAFILYFIVCELKMK